MRKAIKDIKEWKINLQKNLEEVNENLDKLRETREDIEEKIEEIDELLHFLSSSLEENSYSDTRAEQMEQAYLAERESNPERKMPVKRPASKYSNASRSKGDF